MPGQIIIDPDTGLELEVLQPTPPMWSADSVRGRMLAEDPTQGGASAGGNPFTEALQAENAVPDPMVATTPAPLSGATAAPRSGLRPSSLLDKVMFAAFGTPDSMLTGDEQGARAAKRKQVSAMATSAATNPGEAHMGIPSVDGDSFGDSIFKIAKLFAGGGG